jgi:hypothetical protein
MQPSTYPRGLASSQDPQNLSLTVSSAAQLILWLVGMVAVDKGFDPLAATNAAQAYIDVAINAAPAFMVIYHTVMMFWGLIRKGLSYFKKQPATVSSVALSPSPTAAANQ